MEERVVCPCPVFVCLWESLSAAAWSLSSAECLRRSAAEWSEEEALLECGSFVESVRCVVRAEVWEALAESLAVSDAWERVSCAVDDWRACVESSGRSAELWSCLSLYRMPGEERVVCPVAGVLISGMGCAGCEVAEV